jgi:mono/diheme cytochrome c family protein
MRFRFALLLLLAIFAVGVSGCGGGEESSPTPETVEGTVPGGGETTDTSGGNGGTAQGDPEAGKEVFASAGCGGCHALEAAGSSGAVGPNLDEAKPDHDLVVERVTNGQGVMPSFKDQLSEQQIQDVAAFVTQSVGTS